MTEQLGRQAMIEFLAAHIQQTELRWRGEPGTLRQMQAGKAVAITVIQALQCRRGRAEDHRDIQVAGADHRQITGGVAKSFLLFE